MTTPAKASASRIVSVIADPHFDRHDRKAWNAYRKWHRHIRPAETVVLGDAIDLGMLSHFLQGPEDPVNAIEQVQCFVREMNALWQHTGRMVVMEGNHEARWEKALIGAHGPAFKGAIGLTLREQCFAQGLDKRTEWRTEQPGAKPLPIGQFQLEHGHTDSRGAFGRGKYSAANKLASNNFHSIAFGHDHRFQWYCQTGGGATDIGISVPCLLEDQGYRIRPNWQRGFLILELNAPTYEIATPHPVLMLDGRFSWGGRTYDGGTPMVKTPAKPAPQVSPQVT